MPVSVRVFGVPDWVDARRLIGEAARREGDGWTLVCDRATAADLQARLRGVELAAKRVQVAITPPLKRSLVRAARTRDARARRDTTPGFTRAGVRLDEEGRRSLTPEALASALGDRFAGREVVDATCGLGGNAIGFARAGCRVTAFETDPARLDAARHHAGLYGVSERIRFELGRAEERVEGGDVLFVDPPWSRADLAPLPVLLERRASFRVVLAKLPPATDPARWPGATPEAWFGERPGDRRRVKFVLLTWE